MGLGNCCNSSIIGCPSLIKSYFGESSLDNNYFDLPGLSQRKATSSAVLTASRGAVGNYIYDIDSNSKYLAVAMGDRGATIFRADNNGEFVIGNTNEVYFSGAIEGQTSQQSSNKFYGASLSYGEFYRGDALGARYGFEFKQFLGCYGVCLVGNILIGAMGTGGVMYADLTTGEYDTLISGNENIIVNNVKVYSGKLYVGTTGWDKPKFLYSNNFLQTKFQPEYNGGFDVFDSNKNYYSNGVIVYNYSKLFSSELNEVNSSLEGIIPLGSENVNSISAGGDSVYVATGRREDSGVGLSAYGSVHKINASTLSSSMIYKTNNGSITDIDVDNGVPYWVDTSYGIIRDGSPWIQIMQNSGDPTVSIQDKVEACDNVPAQCFDFNTFSFYPAIRTVAIDSVLNPTQRFITKVCPIIGSFYKTKETIGIFPSSIQITEECIVVGMYQGGFASFDKGSGVLRSYNYGLYKKISCDYFRESDINAEYSLSIGKMTGKGNKIYAIDSIQYVANGAGPGVYNPVIQSENPMNFIGLVRGFESFSGIITIT
jgi:hypothetical protein